MVIFQCHVSFFRGVRRMCFYLAEFWRILGSWLILGILGFMATPPDQLCRNLACQSGKQRHLKLWWLLSRGFDPCSCLMVKAHAGRRWLWDFLGIKGLFDSNRDFHSKSEVTTSVSISTNLKPVFQPKNQFSHCFHRDLPCHFNSKGLIPLLFCKNLMGPEIRQEKWVFPWKEIRKDPQKSGEK